MVSDGGNGITITNELILIKPLDYQKCIDLIDECKEKDLFGLFHQIIKQED